MKTTSMQIGDLDEINVDPAHLDPYKARKMAERCRQSISRSLRGAKHTLRSKVSFLNEYIIKIQCVLSESILTLVFKSFIKLMQESGEPFDLPFSTSPVPTPSREVQKAIVHKAHSYNMITVGHALSIKDTLSLLDSGVDGFAHACCEKLSERDLQAFCEKRPFVIPTLVIQASAGCEEIESREIFSQDLSKEDRTHMCECIGIARNGFTMHNAAQNTQLFRKAGLDIVWYVTVHSSFEWFAKL